MASRDITNLRKIGKPAVWRDSPGTSRAPSGALFSVGGCAIMPSTVLWFRVTGCLHKSDMLEYKYETALET